MTALKDHGLRMFWIEEHPEVMLIAADVDHARRVYLEHQEIDGQPELNISELELDSHLSGWCRWDQERQTHVYVNPDPTVRQVLFGDEALKLVAVTEPGVLSGDVDDAVFDTTDGQPPEGLEA